MVTLLQPVPSLGWSLVGGCLRPQAPTSSAVQKDVGPSQGPGEGAPLADVALITGPLPCHPQSVALAPGWQKEGALQPQARETDTTRGRAQDVQSGPPKAWAMQRRMQNPGAGASGGGDGGGCQAEAPGCTRKAGGGGHKAGQGCAGCVGLCGPCSLMPCVCRDRRVPGTALQKRRLLQGPPRGLRLPVPRRLRWSPL